MVGQSLASWTARRGRPCLVLCPIFSPSDNMVAGLFDPCRDRGVLGGVDGAGGVAALDGVWEVYGMGFHFGEDAFEVVFEVGGGVAVCPHGEGAAWVEVGFHLFQAFGLVEAAVGIV